MKLTKRTTNILIVTIYLIALFFSLTSSGIIFIDKLRSILSVLLPAFLTLMILYENRRNLKVLLKNKFSFILYILVIIWFFMTFIFGIRTNIESLKGFINFSVLSTFILVLFNCNYDEETKNRIKKHIFISFSLVTVLGILQYIFRYNLNTYNNDKYPGILGRIHSTFYIATLLDKYIVIMFPIITYELLKDKENKYYKFLLILSTLAITFTFSRSGQLIYLAMSFIFFIVTLFKKQFKNSILIVLLIVIMVLIPGAKYSVQSAMDYAYEAAHMPNVLRVNLIDILGSKNDKIVHVKAGKCADEDCVGDEEGSNFFRNYYKKVGIQFIKEYPIFGVGIGNNSYLYNNQNAKDYLKNKSVISDDYKYMYPHSGYIQLAEETGIIGCTLFILYLLSFALNKILSKKDRMDIYVLGLMIFAFALGNITEGLFHTKQIIYIFAIIYTLYCNISFNVKDKKNHKKVKNFTK